MDHSFDHIVVFLTFLKHFLWCASSPLFKKSLHRPHLCWFVDFLPQVRGFKLPLRPPADTTTSSTCFNELNRSINDTGTNFPSPQPLQLQQSCSITPSSGLHSSSIYHRPYLLNRPTAFRQQGIHLSAGRRTAVKRPTYRGGYKSRQETWS